MGQPGARLVKCGVAHKGALMRIGPSLPSPVALYSFVTTEDSILTIIKAVLRGNRIENPAAHAEY